MRLSTTPEYLTWALQDNGAVELRHEHGGRWITGWFDALDALLAAARERHKAGNLYCSLNAPKPRLVRNGMVGEPLRNEEVAFLTRLPFDFDPVRPTGMCSTDEELGYALERRNGLVDMLTKSGWPLPLHAKSGNGYHAVYRARLPNNDETREMVGTVYRGLHREFDDDVVGFDRSVRNPGRIFRLYGSINRKGPNTADRPHRQSTVWIPPRWAQVPQKQLSALADHYARQSRPDPVRPHVGHTAIHGAGDYKTLDIVSWMQARGLYRHHIERHLHSVWCPWQAEHTTPHGTNGAIVYEADGGWPGFYCHHGHCQGRGLKDLMAHLGDADTYCGTAYHGGQAK